MNYIMGIDIGTTSTKTIIINDRGKILYSTLNNQNLISINPGWAEEEPEKWWQNTCLNIQKCFNESEIRPENISAIGVTGMVPALVLLGKDSQIIRRSIQQNDARTIKQLSLLEDNINSEYFFNKTGGSINQQLIGPKIMWLKKNEPKIYKKIHKIMGSYDYINYKLTGTYSLEHNWALESGLLNISDKKWDNELLDLCSIRKEWLPRIVESEEIIGTISTEVSHLTGLNEGTPVIGGIADHVSSAFTAGLTDEGNLNIKFGGAGDILYSLGKLVTDRRLYIDYHAIPGKYMINGCMASSGSLLKWFKKEFCRYEEYTLGSDEQAVFQLLNNQAEALPPGPNGLIILPYFLGEKTPIHDPLARGVIFGLGLHHKRQHIYKALMEAVIYGFLNHIEVLRELELPIKKVIATDGGAKSKLWRQIAADIIGEPVLYIKDHPGSSLGAAFIAGKAVGIFNAWNEIEKFINIESITEPIYHNHQRYQEYYNLYKDLYHKLQQSYIDLNNIHDKDDSWT